MKLITRLREQSDNLCHHCNGRGYLWKQIIPCLAPEVCQHMQHYEQTPCPQCDGRRVANRWQMAYRLLKTAVSIYITKRAAK
jgi:DnaJ-class molecular chaperone